MCSSSCQRVLSCAVDRQVQPQGPQKAPNVDLKRPRKAPERGLRGLKQASYRAHKPRPWPSAAPRSPFKPLRDPRTRGPAPQEGQRELQEAPDEAQDGPQRAQDGVQKAAGRVDGTSSDENVKICFPPRRERDFRGSDGPEKGPRSAQSGPKKIGRTEDSTRAAEHWASRAEIRPRTADGRLEEGSGTTATQIKPEVKIHFLGQPCD